MRKVNNGLSEEQLQKINNLLNHDLADSYLLIIKTKKYHWDVVGPQFRSLHELLREQYEAISENIDAIAERIRALGGYPLGTAAGFLEYSSISEHSGDIPSATGMVDNLSRDHEQIVRNLRQHSNMCDEELNDKPTSDFLNSLVQQHEEMAWMLRSFIEGESLQPDRDALGKQTVTVS